MDTNLPALLAAVAASAGICGHGIVGHRWLVAQLGSIEMETTPLSIRLFGDRDVAWQVLGVAWHCVTAVFVASALALYLTAFGALESRDLLRFIAVLHVAFLAVGSVYLARWPDGLLQPIPALFAVAMTTAALFAWIASDSGQLQ
jgi:hypothetical protein